MRKINAQNFRIATRNTAREINRQIALTLIQTHQPISRADLSRLMNTNRMNVSGLINELLGEGLIREGEFEQEIKRGRPSIMLYMAVQRKCVVAVDIRASRTYLMITNNLGEPLEPVISFRTERDPDIFTAALIGQTNILLERYGGSSNCAGIGIAMPGILDMRSEKIVRVPTLDWYDFDLASRLKMEFKNTAIHIENSAKACALSQIWASRDEIHRQDDVAFVSISDGVGVGFVMHGELVRGRHNMAGEFGHLPINFDGPVCSCGSKGCLEAYVSNVATVSRYLGNGHKSNGSPDITINDLIQRARTGEKKALETLRLTGRYLGIGLISVINAIDPTCIYLGGEITEAWDLIEFEVRRVIAERTLTRGLGETQIRIVPAVEFPRLRGAAALITAPTFAAPKVA